MYGLFSCNALSTIPRIKKSKDVNVVYEGSPSRMRRVRRISLGMTMSVPVNERRLYRRFGFGSKKETGFAHEDGTQENLANAHSTCGTSPVPNKTNNYCHRFHTGELFCELLIYMPALDIIMPFLYTWRTPLCTIKISCGIARCGLVSH